jgi:flavorubredoxin
VDLNPSDYEVVVIGSPTWNGTVSTPIRTYIAEYKTSLRNVALFSTGVSDQPVAVDEMEMLIGCKSIAKLHLLKKQVVENGEYQSKVDDFTQKIKDFLGVQS